MFLIAIGSSCLAGENIKSKRRVIEFNQNAFISEINKDKLKYKHLYEYSDGELYALFVKYVAYNELLNEEDVDQIFNTKEVLNDLQTILEIVGKDKKKLKFTVCSEEEQDKVNDKLASLFNEYGQALSSEEYQLAEKISERLGEVTESWVREMHTKCQMQGGLGIVAGNNMFSAYGIFDLHFTPWIVSKDSSGFLTVDEQLFWHTMEDIKIGTYINFYVLNQIGENINGHAMLITKNKDDDFAFFDPSRGIMLNLTIDELFELVNDTLRFLEENVFNNTGYINVLFNNNTKAIEGIKSKFVVSPITLYFLEFSFYLS
ncbi:MAG: hypothetical protein sGL2_09880 [Candidatus Mesenet longicola]|nr:MAG: hypothetical protein sGL2_09880 [Candidatus Mesenet longicola]